MIAWSTNNLHSTKRVLVQCRATNCRWKTRLMASVLRDADVRARAEEYNAKQLPSRHLCYVLLSGWFEHGQTVFLKKNAYKVQKKVYYIKEEDGKKLKIPSEVVFSDRSNFKDRCRVPQNVLLLRRLSFNSFWNTKFLPSGLKFGSEKVSNSLISNRRR